MEFCTIFLYNNFVNNKHASMINYVLQLCGNFGVCLESLLLINYGFLYAKSYDYHNVF